MIKRVVPMFIIGVLLVIGVSLVYSGADRYEQSHTMTITGVASGDDSTLTDSFPIFNTMHYGNRYWLTIDFDSVIEHEPSGFGLRDSIFVVLSTEFAGQRVVLDSVEDTLKDDTYLTLNFKSDGGDSLYKFGEQLWLKIRIADTVGASTDSVHNFRFTISGIHLWQD